MTFYQLRGDLTVHRFGEVRRPAPSAVFKRPAPSAELFYQFRGGLTVHRFGEVRRPAPSADRLSAGEVRRPAPSALTCAERVDLRRAR